MTAIEPLALIPGHWAHDPAHSSVGFTVRHLGVSKVRGRFTTFDTDVVVGATLETTSVTATIDLASIDTANADRDNHVRSADIIDVANRPTLTFRSTNLTPAGDGWALTGDVTIGGVTKPVTLAVEFGGIEDFPGGPRHAGLEATGELRRSDFEIAPTIPSSFLGGVIKIELDDTRSAAQLASAGWRRGTAGLPDPRHDWRRRLGYRQGGVQPQPVRPLWRTAAGIARAEHVVGQGVDRCRGEPVVGSELLGNRAARTERLGRLVDPAG
jgi:polyisoprenoid-binding protein YceI